MSVLLAQRLQSKDWVRLDKDRHATQMRRDKPLNKCDVFLFIDPHPDSRLAKSLVDSFFSGRVFIDNPAQHHAFDVWQQQNPLIPADNVLY